MNGLRFNDLSAGEPHALRQLHMTVPRAELRRRLSARINAELLEWLDRPPRSQATTRFP